MIAPELIKILQQLNREEKQEVIRFLREKLSDDIDRIPKGVRIFKTWPTIISSDGGAALKRIVDEEQAKRD